VVDILTLALTHGLMAIALWRLLWRDDLDRDGETPRRPKPWLAARRADSDEAA
jgi:hypothetical protein